jgi:AcrR family transcriptional regulator
VTLRADAQRNLDRLLSAAGECFAERGLDASVDEIARRAGVGHGTVFRRFPTKDALLTAVLGRELERLHEAAEEALADPDPGAGFERFFRAAAGAYGRNRALLEAVDRFGELPPKLALEDAASRLVRRAQRAGVVRRDLGVEDVLALVPAASRYPDVILAGLRSPAATRRS